MILTAALASGMALVRAINASNAYRLKTWFLKPTGSWPDIRTVGFVVVPIYRLLAAPFGPALLVLAWSSPQQRGRAWRQPGIVAGAAITVALVVRMTYLVPILATIGVNSAFDKGLFAGPNKGLFELGGGVAFAILGAWTALVVGGRWRPGRSWPARLGLVVGGLWVAGYLFHRGAILFGAIAT